MDDIYRFYTNIQESKSYIEENIVDIAFPTFVLVTGTGLSSIVDELETIVEIPYGNIPHFPKSTVQSHQGKLFISSYKGINVVILAGRWHYYEGYTAKEVTYPIRVMKALGVETILLTNVAGGVNEGFEPGDLVVLKDHINFMPDHPLRGPNDPRLGVRFPDMMQTYNKSLIKTIHSAGAENNIKLKEGIYFALQGPSLETPAEYAMIHKMGADMVGMSTVPEVIVAKHSSMTVGAISIISNICYPPERLTETTIDQVITVATSGSKKLNRVIKTLIQKTSTI